MTKVGQIRLPKSPSWMASFSGHTRTLYSIIKRS